MVSVLENPFIYVRRYAENVWEEEEGNSSDDFQVIGLQGVFFFPVVLCAPSSLAMRRYQVFFLCIFVVLFCFCTWKAKAFKERGTQWKLPQPGPPPPIRKNKTKHPSQPSAPINPPISLGFGVQEGSTLSSKGLSLGPLPGSHHLGVGCSISACWPRGGLRDGQGWAVTWGHSWCFPTGGHLPGSHHSSRPEAPSGRPASPAPAALPAARSRPSARGCGDNRSRV